LAEYTASLVGGSTWSCDRHMLDDTDY